MDATHHDHYCDCLKKLSTVPLAAHARTLGLSRDGTRLWLPFFNNPYAINAGPIVDRQGRKPTDAVALVLCRYLLNHPMVSIPDGPRVTFRELAGAGPLVTQFAANTHKIITSAYAENLDQLTERSLGLGAVPSESPGGYDLHMRFDALPNLPLWLLFNGVEAPFPAQCTLVFQQSAQHYLDMQSLFIVCTYLTGQLVNR